MSQASISIANSAGASVRAAINAALEAMTTGFSGASAPSTTYPYMPWNDTANDLAKLRNGANSAWINKGTLSAAYGGLPASSITYSPGSPSTLTASNVQSAIDELASRPTGVVLQTQRTQSGVVTTGTTQTPSDDTIPQNTEGDQYMILSITPISPSSILEIDVVWNGSSDSATSAILTVALHQDSIADAIAVGWVRLDSTNAPCSVAFRHRMTAGTISQLTFKVRAGVNGAGTTTFNGTAGNRRYGGAMASSITVRELTS